MVYRSYNLNGLMVFDWETFTSVYVHAGIFEKQFDTDAHIQPTEYANSVILMDSDKAYGNIGKLVEFSHWITLKLPF